MKETIKMNTRACRCYYCGKASPLVEAGKLYAEVMRGKGVNPRYMCEYHRNNAIYVEAQSNNSTDKVGEARKSVKIVVEFYGNNSKAEAIKVHANAFGTFERIGANRFKVTSEYEQGFKKLSCMLQHIDEIEMLGCVKKIHATCNGKEYDVIKVNNRALAVKELQNFRSHC